MSYDIRKPMISAPTAEGQLLQIKSYLIQLVDQLNFALRTPESSAGNVSGTGEEPSLKLTTGLFSEIKSLIMKSSDIINAYYEKMEPKFGEKIKEHNTAEDSHADIRELIEELTKKLGELEGGEDGVSPTIEVSKTGSVTTITITDVGGTTTATINDGAKGDKGDKGDRGITGVHIGSDTPPDGVNVWINPNGEPTSVENWEFDLEDGSSDTKTVVVLDSDDASSGSKAAIMRLKQADGTWVEIPAIIGPKYVLTDADKAEIVNMVLASLPT